MVNLLIPFLNPSSTSFNIKYIYNGITVASVSSGVVVLPYCTSPCQRCSTSPTICLSCLPSPNTYIIYFSLNNTCLNGCPTGYFTNSTICSICVSPCLTCSTISMCNSCVNGTWLYSGNNTCSNSCPSGFYNESSGNCTTCVSPCATCLAFSSCLSCSTNYFTNFSCVNGSLCPNGTYPNATTLKC